MIAKINGVLGIATNDLPSIKTRDCPYYPTWKTMLGRCYSISNKDFKYYGQRGVIVDDRWKLRSAFNTWMVNNNFEEGLQLDKDILQKDCPIYSPETCCLIPAYINNFFNTNSGKNCELPAGVTRRLPTKDMVNDYTNPFVARIRLAEDGMKTLGYFSSQEEAHRAWQLAKSAQFSKLIERYAYETFFNTYVHKALLERLTSLLDDLNSNKTTIKI